MDDDDDHRPVEALKKPSTTTTMMTETAATSTTDTNIKGIECEKTNVNGVRLCKEKRIERCAQGHECDDEQHASTRDYSTPTDQPHPHPHPPYNQSTMCENDSNSNSNSQSHSVSGDRARRARRAIASIQRKGKRNQNWKVVYESWSTNLKGYKYKWNIKLKWISVIWKLNIFLCPVTRGINKC